MNQQQVTEQCTALFSQVPGNILQREDKVPSRYVGTALFEAPIVGFGAADDPLFARFRSPEVIGPWFMLPEEWQPGAKAIVSLFFPMSETVAESNRKSEGKASGLWTIARIEGQAFISAYTEALCAWFREQGFECCGPCVDPRFQKVVAGKGIEGYDEITPDTFGSRWSERHVAWLCGLGTFGLSKGLITERGMAGRFTSVIVTAPLEADPRPYTELYEYCIACGACARRCPVGAIDPEKGKDHKKCSAYLKKSGVIHYPRYGCGLCQTNVPCERCNPSRKKEVR